MHHAGERKRGEHRTEDPPIMAGCEEVHQWQDAERARIVGRER